MKLLKHSLLTVLCLFVATASALDAAKVQRILAKNADGTTVDVTDQFSNEDGMISSGDQELMVTTEDGSVVTITPNSSVVIGSSAEGTTQVTVVTGAVVATSQGAPLSVTTVAGTFTTNGGNVFVSQTVGGDNNIIVTAVNAAGGDATFTPSDASAGTAPFALVAGEQAVVEGQSDEGSFKAAAPVVPTKANPGIVVAVQQTANASASIAATLPAAPTQGPAQPTQSQSETPTVVDPIVIDIPVDNVEIASNPG